MKTKTIIERRTSARLLCMEHAKQRAAEDIAFASAGFNPLKLTPDQLTAVKVALVFYAQNGASQAFDTLSNNALLAESISL